MEVTIISTNLEIQIKELKPWLKRETPSILQPLNEEHKKLVDKIKERLDDAREICEKLAEEGKKGIESGKAVRKAKVTEKLSKYFLKQIDKIVFPEEMSFNKLDKLHKDLEKMFSSIARERNAWFPRISPLFIIARKRVDFAFSRLAGSISELSVFLSGDYSKARVVEELFLETDETMRLLNELSKVEGRKAGIKEKMQSFQKKIEENEQTIESIKDSVELGDLAEMNRRVQQLRKQVNYDFRHFRKPFLKFANLTRGPGYTLKSEEAEKLSQYLDDPFIAFATEEPGYPTLKSILKKIKRAMDEGKLKLKSSRLRKGREEINAILNENTLDDLHQNCAHAFSLNQQLLSSEETQVAQRKIKQLRERLKELRKRKKTATVKLDASKKEHDQLLEKAKKQKKMLERSIYNILERNVNISFR
ncbi:MAG: hypothetical protein OEX01_01120 [Candidatus Bathyarchaeota archaeon]|nr:hypothetical protein [Candidatus Bathyarchaeota archaeon]